MQQFPLALTIMTTAGHINNKHLTFSLIKTSAEQEKDFMDHTFFISVLSKDHDGNCNYKRTLDSRQS